MKSKNAFTIIEMLIVICIITIILGFTMSFSGGRIQLLNSKNMKEEFISAYNDQLSMVMNSNYYGEHAYDRLNLTFSNGGSGFYYEYKNGENPINSGNINIMGINIENLYLGKNIYTGTNKSLTGNLIIGFTPYQIGCTINNQTENNGIIKLSINNGREDSCFRIKPTIGRLEECDCSSCGIINNDSSSQVQSTTSEK